MERLNLNVPSETRAALQRLARRSGRKEAEVARELLVAAAENAEREAFYEAMRSEMTEGARQRLSAMARALEKVRHRAR
jgi:predicted DNA-binding protein